MFAKIIAFVAVVATIATAEPCGFCGGYLSTGVGGVYGSGVLNAGYSVPVVSTVPACGTVAVPTQVVDPIPTRIVAPVVSTGIVSSGVIGTGIYGSGFYGGYGYGSTLHGCGAGVLSTVY